MHLQLLINGLAQGLVVALGALAITLPFGIARFPNNATGDGMTLGAYAALVGTTVTGSLILGGMLALVVGMAVSCLAYWLVYRPLSGRPMVALLVASIGVAFVIRAGLELTFGHSQQVLPAPMWRPYLMNGVRIAPLDLLLAAFAASVMLALFLLLHATPIGRQMRAVADNRELARMSGVRLQPVMLTLWAVTGMVSASGGVVLGIKTVVRPEVGWDMLMPCFAAAVLGGIGSPLGAVVAGLLLGAFQELSTPYIGFTYKIVFAFAVMLAVLIIRPSGLFGRVEAVR